MSTIRSVMSVSCKAGPATATGKRFAIPMQRCVRFHLSQGAVERQVAYDKIVVRGTTGDSNAEMDDKCPAIPESLEKFLLEYRVRDVTARLMFVP